MCSILVVEVAKKITDEKIPLSRHLCPFSHMLELNSGHELGLSVNGMNVLQTDPVRCSHLQPNNSFISKRETDIILT